MIRQTPRHDFLHSLHELLRPATYLEIGVQTGRSLAQAQPPTHAIVVDPAPQISVPIAVGYDLFPMTSDDFFARQWPDFLNEDIPVDLAFIDGMHLVENCLRDFMGVERLARPDGRTVAVFDDVLPYSAAIAGREPLPGDWAGDCWKIYPILDGLRPELTCILVDVAPTGALVVLDLESSNTILTRQYDNIIVDFAREFGDPTTAAQIALSHRTVVGPALAIDLIRAHLNITEA